MACHNLEKDQMGEWLNVERSVEEIHLVLIGYFDALQQKALQG